MQDAIEGMGGLNLDGRSIIANKAQSPGSGGSGGGFRNNRGGGEVGGEESESRRKGWHWWWRRSCSTGSGWVVGRCEEICLSGGLVRQKMKFLHFLRKRMNTKPSHSPIDLRSPAKMVWCTIRKMILSKMKRGTAAPARLEAYERVPRPHDNMKRMVIPDALKVLRMQAATGAQVLSARAALQGGRMEEKRKQRAQVILMREGSCRPSCVSR